MATLSGREIQTDILKQMLHSTKAEFLALYGRRRIGKTHLILSYFTNKKNLAFFDVTGTKASPMKEQIANFTSRISEVFYDGINIEPPINWNGAFKLLSKGIDRVESHKKVVIFFDELPWMASKNSRLLQNLEYYWNQYWSKDKRLKLIICGSSASWIIDKVINNKGGLHNRITRQIHLQPFTLAQTKIFLKQQKITLSNKQIVQIYMVTGGVAYYLMMIEKGLSATQNIEKLAFLRDAPLINEFDRLFSSLFDNHEMYVDFIRLIAKHHYGIGKEEIFQKIGSSIKGMRGNSILKALEDAGFIMCFKSHLNKRRGIYYKVIDEYTLFYLRFIEPMTSKLAQQSLEPGYWQMQRKQGAWYSWAGLAFESICYKHIAQIKKALSLSPVCLASTWRYVPKKKSVEQGAQIDLLFDRADDAITLCEIKYTDSEYIIDKQTVEALLRKKSVFQKQTRCKKQIFIALISAAGIKNNFYADETISNVVTLDDFFK